MSTFGIKKELDQRWNTSGAYTSYRDALKVLQTVSPEHNELTLGGHIIKNISFSSAAICKDILWVMLELDIQEATRGKSTRICPIPTSANLVIGVNNLFSEFFADEEAWEKKTENWLPLSEVMNQCDKLEETKDILIFIIVINQALIKMFKGSDSYTEGDIGLIYNDDNNFVLDCVSSNKGINVNDKWGEGKRDFGLFYNWLRDDVPKQLKHVDYYVGYRYMNTEETRLWAAYSIDGSNISEREIIARILQVSHFGEIIHNQFLKNIKGSILQGKLDKFISAVLDLDPHDKKEFEIAKKALTNFLGISSLSDLTFEVSDYYLAECLKTVCGKTSQFGSGDRPLSVLAAFYIFLGAVVGRLGNSYLPLKCSTKSNSQIIWEIEHVAAAYDFPVFPQRKIPGDFALQCTEKMFEMFKEFIIHDTTPLLRKVRVSEAGIELTTKKPVDSKSLQRGIKVAHAKKIGHIPPLDKKVSGNTSKAIIEFWRCASCRNHEELELGSAGFFPPKGGISLEEGNDYFKLTVLPC